MYCSSIKVNSNIIPIYTFFFWAEVGKKNDTTQLMKKLFSTNEDFTPR